MPKLIMDRNIKQSLIKSESLSLAGQFLAKFLEAIEKKKNAYHYHCKHDALWTCLDNETKKVYTHTEKKRNLKINKCNSTLS